jgi:POT family proton-dependent oligopeptide transporter
MGFFLTVPAFLIPALIEVWVAQDALPNIAWQLFAYAVITAAEVFVSITALEFSYTQAPKKMKSFVMAAYLMSVSVGNMAVSVVNVFIQNPTPEFTPDVPGTYELELTATDGAETTSKTVSIEVLAKAVEEEDEKAKTKPLDADAGRFTAVQKGQLVRLYGSVDRGDTKQWWKHEWQVKRAPSGSKVDTAGLESSYTLSPAFVPDLEGSYQLELTVSADQQRVVKTVDVEVTSAEVAPVVTVSADGGVVGKAVSLDGGKSYDPDGDELTYSWAFAGKPTGSTLSDGDIRGSTFASATTILEGANYYLFWAGLMFLNALLFLPVMVLYKVQVYIQDEEEENVSA